MVAWSCDVVMLFRANNMVWSTDMVEYRKVPNIISAHTVWTERPMIIQCRCLHTGFLLCKRAGSSSAGHLGIFW